MKTKIYNSYSEFLSREDKKENGVSSDFAKAIPFFENDNLTNESCWNCSNCSYCSYCRSCSSCRYCSNCRSCSDCRSCRSCSDCSYCRSCRSCRDEKNTNKKEGEKPAFIVPILENVHQKVLEAVTTPKHHLKMDDWHTCGTTHCRAGWVVHLSGEAGYLLEKQTDTCFAAMMIYKKSSPNIKVSPVRFFETNEMAFADIERCAQLEKEIGE